MAHRQTLCERGHDMDDAYVSPTGQRRCRECARAAIRTLARPLAVRVKYAPDPADPAVQMYRAEAARRGISIGGAHGQSRVGGGPA